MPYEPIPAKMKAVVLKDYDGSPLSLSVSELPIPALTSGQVLVKIAAASINPSDLVFLRGQYGITKALPVVPGFEASGTVVASGGGLLGRWLVGKRVACHAPEDGNGTWADYMVSSAKTCLPLASDISQEQGASLIVNPMTACALIDIVRAEHQTAFVQTAASSALGQMLIRLARKYGMTGIHVVRRQEHIPKLKDLGAEYVFDVNDPLFQDRLSEACYKFKIKIAFDAVGGALTSQLAAALPKDGRVIVYGALSGENCQIRATDLIFYNERLEGFWLTEWVKTKNWWNYWRFSKRVQRLMPTELKTHVQARYPLDRYAEAITLYKKNRSSGKVLLTPAGN